MSIVISVRDEASTPCRAPNLYRDPSDSVVYKRSRRWTLGVGCRVDIIKRGATGFRVGRTDDPRFKEGREWAKAAQFDRDRKTDASQ